MQRQRAENKVPQQRQIQSEQTRRQKTEKAMNSPDSAIKSEKTDQSFAGLLTTPIPLVSRKIRYDDYLMTV
jgi:tRNA A37 threonylcarbamoyltransferase TsaD